MPGVSRHVGALAVITLLGVATPARAQLDPLLFLKRLPPNVILVVDTSLSMLEDGEGKFYDPHTYQASDDDLVAAAMRLNSGRTREYRRIYHGLDYERQTTASGKYTATTITAVPDHDPAFGSFWNDTRLEIAKRGIGHAVKENDGIGLRWSLVGLRQQNPTWRLSPDCDKPVRVTGNSQLARAGDTNPCHAGGHNRYALYPPTVDAPNHSLTSARGVLLPFGSTDAPSIAALLSRPVNDPLGLIPAGQDTNGYDDRPLEFALDDALSEARAAITSDGNGVDCRNTVVVLVTGGTDAGDPAYHRSHDITRTARRFARVGGPGGTRRVPIYVVAIRPESGEDELESVAAASGGQYFNVSTDDEIARVINTAIQTAYARSVDYNRGERSEFQTVSPVVGTVDLSNASSAQGGRLSQSTALDHGGVEVPQRGNVMVTAGFELNGLETGGMEGVVRAFRTFRPVRDRSQPTGYAFVSDGTPLWPDTDGRPETQGKARVPRDPIERNIFTYLPGSGTTAFTQANAQLLAPHVGDVDVNALIPFIRSLPLGPVIGSTPALMEPPSQIPPPDTDYGRPGVPGTYAGDYEHRRSIIWVGGNNGMIHGIDARTGFEVWAFIPYNLLPKLQTLLDGRSIDEFDYFVDSSPKLADVKLDGRWRTVLVIGQAYGGTFYQAFDVTDAGMGGPPPQSDSHGAVLTSFASPSRVPFLWSYPRYSQFDPTVSASFSVNDGYPGGRVHFFGDLKAGASSAEKTVGFTWSTPAIAPLSSDRDVTAVVVGSGYFPAVETQLPGRGPQAPSAGRALYLLDIETGSLIGNSGTCGGSGSTGCVDVGDHAADGRKNAIHADPTLSGATDYTVEASRAYVGDLDGTLRRFDIRSDGTISFSSLENTGQPIYSSSALALAGSHTHVFFATGSDLLSPSTSGGADIFKLYGLRDNAPGEGASVTFVRSLEGSQDTGNGNANGNNNSGGNDNANGNSDGQNTGGPVERPTTSPAVAGGVVFFTTVVEDTSRPCEDFTSRLYGLTFLGGAAYDTDGSGSVTEREDPVISTVDGRATSPFVADDHVFLGTSGGEGSQVEMFGDPENFNTVIGQVGLRLLSWRGPR